MLYLSAVFTFFLAQEAYGTVVAGLQSGTCFLKYVRLIFVAPHSAAASFPLLVKLQGR